MTLTFIPYPLLCITEKTNQPLKFFKIISNTKINDNKAQKYYTIFSELSLKCVKKAIRLPEMRSTKAATGSSLLKKYALKKIDREIPMFESSLWYNKQNKYSRITGITKMKTPEKFVIFCKICKIFKNCKNSNF